MQDPQGKLLSVFLENTLESTKLQKLKRRVEIFRRALAIFLNVEHNNSEPIIQVQNPFSSLTPVRISRTHFGHAPFSLSLKSDPQLPELLRVAAK
ncbi:hypothetical protein CEXT_280671 [Caerostris extrusa]|uniref:Uncharacterized protein n=1 Tax=Caerostris extrusa TaxID=172846 RepID=A0AAV4M3Y4_CAEEX|nr:hypothetical protein CEXT_280671 [Caerostris extrusa]